MKKAMLVLCVTLLCVTAVSAQGFKVGLKAGFNASTITNFPEVQGTTNYYLPGFQAGLMAQSMFSRQFGLETGLYYSTLGIKQKGTVVTVTTRPSYIQLPLTLLYKFDAGLGLLLYPQAGAYVGYGIGGKSKTTPGEISVDFFNDNMNRFDAGLTFGFNVEHSGFVVGLGYDLGLMKINKNNLVAGNDYKNANIKVTVGHFF